MGPFVLAANNLDQAKEYLARVLPWPQEGEQAWVNIHYMFQPENLEPGKKLPLLGYPVANFNQAIPQLQRVLTNPRARDVYVCMSSQSQTVDKVSANGYRYKVAVRNADYAVSLKALWLDIDVKGADKSSYNDLTEAAADLARWLKEANIPRPTMMVGTGGGMHAYWVVSRALTKSEWKPLAFALVEAVKRHGLKVTDTGVTTDCARLLRIPNTWNCKQDPKRPVRLIGQSLDFDYSYERLAQALDPYKVATPVPGKVTSSSILVDPSLFPPRTPIINNELAAGVDTTMPQGELAQILDAIPNNEVNWIFWNNIGMRCYAATDGADYGLAEWERWSAKNSSAGKTDDCKKRWETYGHSPPTRTGAGALINEARAALGDPSWFPTVPTPATQQGTPASAAAAQAPTDMPSGYTRGSDGRVYMAVPNEDGTTALVPVCDYPLEDAWIQRNPWVLHFKTVTERGKKQQVSIKLDAVGTHDMRRQLQEQGMMVPIGNRATETLGRFLVGWIKKLQETKDSVGSAPFGWMVRSGTLSGFVFGGRLWTPTGSSPAANPDMEILSQYTPTGDMVPWVNAAKMVLDQARPDVAAIVAASFGAPLMRFTGHNGALMAVYSKESGVGKSTAMTVAQSVWGDPIRGTNALSDTNNSTFGKVGELKSLPLFWDEIKTEEGKRKFVELAFQTTAGREKARMRQNTSQREVRTWQTMIVSATNDSLLDEVARATNTTTAGIYRVFEYSIPRPKKVTQIDSADATLMTAKLNDNYGQVGLKYAQFLGVNFARVEREVGSFIRALGQEVSTINDERFWMAVITCVCMGAKYANEIGVATFDEDALKKFMVGVLKIMRREITDQPVDMDDELHVTSRLSQFLKEMRARNTIITNKMHNVKGRPAPGMIKVLNDVTRLDKIQVHIAHDDRIVRISHSGLSDWLEDRKISRHIFISALADKLGARKTTAILGAGTAEGRGKEYLLEIDLKGTTHANFIDEL